MHTGSAITHGHDLCRPGVARGLVAAALQWNYQQLDPDVFGDELAEPAYANADRIADVPLTARKAAA